MRTVEEVAWTRGDDARVARLVDQFTAESRRLEPGHGASMAKRHELRKALVAVDASLAATFAVAWARFLGRTLHTRILFGHVEEPAPLHEAFGRKFSRERRHRGAQQILTDAVNEAGGIGKQVQSNLSPGEFDAILRKGFIVPQLLAAGQRSGSDLTVVGSRGQGPWRRLLLGSVSDALKNQTHHDVLIAKNQPPPRSILLPTDGSTPSMQAARVGLRLARTWKVAVHVLYVVPLRQPRAVKMDVFDETFQEADWLEAKGLNVSFEVRSGRPAEEIVATAHGKGAGLIVIGSRGLSGIRSWVPGGVSNRVAHASRTSVLIVK